MRRRNTPSSSFNSEERALNDFALPSILFLGPEFYKNPGGVQTYMRRLLEILSFYCQKHRVALDVLSLVDREFQQGQHSRPVSFRNFTGANCNKVLYVRGAHRLVTQSRFRLAVVGHLRLVPLVLILKKLGLVRSYVLVLHGVESWGKVSWLRRWSAQNADLIVATTRYTAEIFRTRNGVPSSRFRVIPLALAEERLGLSPGVERVRGGLRILTVARLSVSERPKGIDTLIEAVGRARAEGEEVHLTVAGEGADVPRLKGLADRLGLTPHVAFLGKISEELLSKNYRMCDLFALPSRKEGFGIVFLEAMRFGKPCIGGNHGGIPEVIDDQKTGVLVEYGNVAHLTCSLVEFSRYPERLRELGLHAYQKVQSQYLFPHMRDRWLSLLEEFATP